MTALTPRGPKPKRRDAPPPARAPAIPINRRVKNQKRPTTPGDGRFRTRAASVDHWPARALALWPIERALPYANNPRTHGDEQIQRIMESITEWGFTIPLLADEGGSLIAGHARLEAAKRLGLNRVPVMTARGWTDAQKRAYVIADNQLASLGSWNRDLLVDELKELGSGDLALSLLGFSDAQLRDLCGDEGVPDANASAASPDATTRFLLLVEFDAEAALQTVYDEMLGRGLRVKVMT